MTTATGPHPIDHRSAHRVAAERERLTGASAFARGAGTALDWLLHGGPAPFSGSQAAMPVPVAAVHAEIAVGDLVLAGLPGPGRAYAAGVVEALRWATGLAERPPTAATADLTTEGDDSTTSGRRGGP